VPPGEIPDIPVTATVLAGKPTHDPDRLFPCG
jgi:hypothetical protein